ncbi:hypothetical protein [Pseudomonas sp. MH10]|uniref:pPIWI-associating nuclease domain-containing protein n=1 Tax=Pseudomonas sp. MH10 TaxID=3048627 RepID=UPI002AC98C14|nr:hypothetical protein [Pseudomonas sp. MH10]MEB0043419.1 hypothetical protein [Pseudomonas sp. MH10]WPX63577.1 hypothetical protein RHM59_22315 [Pseudomonas sp. MH10]
MAEEMITIQDPIEWLLGQNEFHHSLYAAALRNLEDVDNKLRFNNFAYALRELTSSILTQRAPKAEVLQCSWYKNEILRPDVKYGVTKIQHARYVVQGGLSDEYVANELKLDLSPERKAIRDSLTELSKYTHVGETTFNLPNHEVEVLVEKSLDALRSLGLAMVNCHSLIAHSLFEAIEDQAIHEVVSDSLEALDSVAHHYSLEHVSVNFSRVERITHDTVHLVAAGFIDVQLQWGSNSDVRRGDGHLQDDSFEFRCKLSCSVENPTAQSLVMEEDSISVDTKAWGLREEEWGFVGTVDSDPSA